MLGSYWFRELVIGCLLVVVFWSLRREVEEFARCLAVRGGGPKFETPADGS